MSIAIQIRNPLLEQDWDEIARSFPEAGFAHGAAWAKVLHRSYGYEPIYFAAMENGTAQGIFPVMEVDSFLTGKRAVALPFTDFCNPLAPDREVFQALLLAAIEAGNQRRWKFLEIRGGTDFLSNQPPWGRFFGHVLNLQKGEKAIRKGLRDSTWRNIKQAQTAGIKVFFSPSAQALDEFIRLNRTTRKAHGLPPQPPTFFEALHDHVISRELGIVAIGDHYGKAVAAAVFLHFGGKVFYKYGASDRKFQHLRPNNLLMWEAILHFGRSGFQSLCFGRTEPEHEGLRQFKRGWGGEETRLCYYRYDFKKGAFVAGRFRSPAVSLGTRVFSHMPAPLVNALGPMIYRHIG
jgi:hypothetical protein